MPRKRIPLAIVYDFDGTLASGRPPEGPRLLPQRPRRGLELPAGRLASAQEVASGGILLATNEGAK